MVNNGDLTIKQKRFYHQNNIYLYNILNPQTYRNIMNILYVYIYNIYACIYIYIYYDIPLCRKMDGNIAG